MARATVLKRFELSPEAAENLERRAKESGKNQTAFVEAWLTSDGGANPIYFTIGNTPASPDVPRYTIACDGCSNVWESVEAFPQTCPRCGEEIALVSPDVQTHPSADDKCVHGALIVQSCAACADVQTNIPVSVKIGGKIERPPLDPIE